ncbi:DUF3017 domain-containing protein [Corynebacterium hansenii]|uniref:DUF3017 domain-containing protein n=1 Tax=Corynebacterium hansenii TaxID=394964 RepID=A0ABV7ZLQ6_9CORY|nr:DUF3017 domain-containing protein [Corynebacterium hansenii]WJY99099.1 hypothetical protein CHAN_02340 [Corynebacterium hansenii]
MTTPRQHRSPRLIEGAATRFGAREIAERADRDDLPDPMVNPHSPEEPAPAESWPERTRWLLYGALFFGLGASVVFLGLERWRRATFMLGLTMMYLGVIRQYLPDSLLGVFSVRSRKFDLWFCLVVGGAMVFLASSVDALGS